MYHSGGGCFKLRRLWVCWGRRYMETPCFPLNSAVKLKLLLKNKIYNNMSFTSVSWKGDKKEIPSWNRPTWPLFSMFPGTSVAAVMVILPCSWFFLILDSSPFAFLPAYSFTHISMHAPPSPPHTQQSRSFLIRVKFTSRFAILLLPLPSSLDKVQTTLPEPTRNLLYIVQ